MTPAEVLADVARRHSIDLATLRGPSRTAWVVKARREAARALASLGMGASEIGRALRRDHSTVLYLLRTEAPTRGNDDAMRFPQAERGAGRPEAPESVQATPFTMSWSSHGGGST